MSSNANTISLRLTVYYSSYQREESYCCQRGPVLEGRSLKLVAVQAQWIYYLLKVSLALVNNSLLGDDKYAN